MWEAPSHAIGWANQQKAGDDRVDYLRRSTLEVSDGVRYRFFSDMVATDRNTIHAEPTWITGVVNVLLEHARCD